MTTVTAPLRDLRRAAEEAEKDAATVAMLQRDLIEAQKVRIGELERQRDRMMDTAIDEVAALREENEALRAVAVAAEWGEQGKRGQYQGYCPICHTTPIHSRDCEYTKARAAGYLREGEEVGK